MSFTNDQLSYILRKPKEKKDPTIKFKKKNSKINKNKKKQKVKIRKTSKTK